MLGGAALRLAHLAPQVLDGDELHAVRAAAGLPLQAILTTYQESDNCIPLTALFRLLLSAGVRLSEVGFRAPSLLAGILLLALPYGLFRARRLPASAALLWGVLLGLSPLLFFYSRIARSYLPMTLAALAAAAAFARWWGTLAPRWAAAYALLGGLAVWLHLGAAPIVAAPFVYALGDLLLGGRNERGRRLLGLAAVAGSLGLAVAAFLVPSRQSLLELVAEKRQPQAIPWETVGDVFELQAGTAHPALVLLFWGGALLGLLLLLREDRRLGLYTLTLAAVQLLGIRLLSPLGLANPLILDRYLLPALPLVLLWVAAALALPWRRAASSPLTGERFFRAAFAVGFPAALVALGPLADPALWRSSFMHHNDFLTFYQPRPRPSPEEVPGLYREIAAAPGPGAVVELPWSSFAGLRVPYLYQEVHGRPVRVSGPQRLLADPALALANFVAPRPEALCASGARFLVVHLHIGREEEPFFVRDEERLGEREMRPDLRRALRGLGEEVNATLTGRWGAPTWAAPGIRAWDLDRACGRRAA
ncbi:MAG TPA: hypothetical protein VMM92_03825 [Thermoanaerobaculia bacterium]|nr:hypothetical protein [Thermoanaerobaculia bacterium]